VLEIREPSVSMKGGLIEATSDVDANGETDSLYKPHVGTARQNREPACRAASRAINMRSKGSSVSVRSEWATMPQRYAGSGCKVRSGRNYASAPSGMHDHAIDRIVGIIAAQA
jgi:hypothetical protein